MTVEIIGRSVRTPSARNVDELFELLSNEVCAVSNIPADRWSMARFWHPVAGTPGKSYSFAAGVLDDIHDFDPAVFGLTAREATYMDPQQKILLQLVWRALEDASLNVTALQKERVGVYVGASSIDSGNLYVEDPASGGPYFMTGNTLSIIANRISHVFGLSGPSLTIDTACSSSLVALDQAVRALHNGEIDTAIVGGINILAHPFSFVGFSQARMLSPEGLCRAYGENGQGYVRAEGGGVVVLRSSAKASANGDRSYATIVATGLNSAGRTNGISLPSRESQAALLRSVYELNGLNPNDLAFIEGHGTGTKVGDPAELWAIGTELGSKRREKLPIGSVKTNVGHSEPASGMVGLVKAMLALQHDFLPASLHAEELSSEIDFDGLNVEVNRAGRAIPRGDNKRLAGINSFGFGGTNAHVVISDPEQQAQTVLPSSGIFMVSAHTQTALTTLLENYATELESNRPGVSEVVSVSAHNRAHHKFRFAVDSVEPDTVQKSIKDYLAGDTAALGHSGEASSTETQIAFVFSGNGCQWAGMALDAYQHETQFRERFDEIGSLFMPWLEVDLVALLQSPELSKHLRDTRIAQALLFAIQATLSDLLIRKNIKPNMVFGHSVGEIAAAYCSGSLSLEDAVAIVAVRSRHQHALSGEGKMAAVSLGAEKAMDFARQHALIGIELGAINTHSSVTISGPADEIAFYRDRARKAHIPVHVLDIDYPFHHSIIDRGKDAFLRELPFYQPDTGDITFISTVTGQVMSGNELDAGYWWSNVRDVVRFSDATAAALNAGCNLFIEISPRAILSSYLTENARQKALSVTTLSTLTRPVRAANPLPHIVAQAIASGASAWQNEDGRGRKSGVTLPPLPFEEQTLRPTETSDRVNVFGRGEGAHSYTLLGWRTDPSAGSWKNHVDANLFPDLAEHVVDGKSILPGSAFIEIAVTAAAQYYGSANIELRNLEILRPLELHTSRISEVSTILSPETGQIEIRSREYLSEDDWSLHAVARARKPVKAQARDAARADRVQQSTKTIDAATAYRTASQFGLDYGPAFRLLKNATVYANNTLSIDLVTPQQPAHPYLTYNLNPMSIDAAFHGLVALFADLTGDMGGAPYIPVRFGTVRLQSISAAICSARIEILRMSPHSLKIRVELFDGQGALVAALDDCRFRRTFLKVHHTLDTIAFHYDRISHVRSVAQDAILPGLVPSFEAAPAAPFTLLLDAAIYRASYDIAHRVIAAFGSVESPAFRHYASLRSYLANCFLILEDCGLATYENGLWLLSPESGLPAVDGVIRELIWTSPESSASAILVNDAYRYTMACLDEISQGGDGTTLSDFKPSDATVDHFRNHVALSAKRIDSVYQMVEAYLQQASSTRSGLVIAEIGATSVAVSSRLAVLADRYDANLFIVESDENLRRTLEVALVNNPRVTVIDGDIAAFSPHVDLAFSANGFLCERLDANGGVRSALRSVVGLGAEILLLEHPSTALDDFVFGLQQDWFGQGVLSDLPVGKMLSTSEMQHLLEDAGFEDVSAHQIEFAEGPLAILTGHGKSAAAELVQLQVRESLLVIRADGLSFPDLNAKKHVTLAWQDNLTPEAAGSAIAKVGVDDLDIVYVLPDSAHDHGHSIAVQEHIDFIGVLAESLRHALTGKNAHRPRLIIVAPGGASTNEAGVNPVNYAIWTFARVLQNEYDEFDVVLMDVRQEHLSAKVWFELLALQETGESELLFNAATGLCQSIRVVPGPDNASLRLVDRFEAATIVQKSPGRIETIEWRATTRPLPQPDDVVVKVAATGLNFRDVMWAMGLLPEEALEDGFAGATIGMEFSGTVVSVGENVSDIKVGDKVMGIGPKAFSTHVSVSQMGLTKIPDSIGLIEAATLPVTFLTAQYALVELARLRAGETVLIHGAAGGVGLAALQIAKLKGAIVIATAGTQEKRNLLAALGADHIFDSRSLDFVGDILDITDDEGVNVVVNSLFSEAMERSIELVKPFGRFLELGKRDYYADRKIGLRPFRKNISYFGIDADQLLVDVPHIAAKVFGEISALFRDKKLKPLPYRTFSYDEVPTAFRLMQSAGHIGKIVITPPETGRDFIQPAPAQTLSLSSGVYLVVGGIGGFGLEAANWLTTKGASHVALATRGGKRDAETSAAIERWKHAGITSSVHACDVTHEAQLSSLLDDLRKIGPLKGIVHAAMVLDDALISNLTRERNSPVIHTKVEGAALLDRLTDQDELDLFLLFSSATTMVGNPGQSNYVAANGYLEGLARSRRARGKPALAVGFGAIADTGFLARNTEVNEKLSHRIGKMALKARDALRFVEEYLTNTHAHASVMIAEIDWAAASALTTVKRPAFSSIGISQFSQQASDGEQIDLYALMDGKPIHEAEATLHAMIATELSLILKLAENNITPDKVLRDIGLDSLMAMELGTSFQQKTGIDLPLSSISDTTTVGNIVGKLRDKLLSRRSGDDSAGEPDELLEGLTSRHSAPKSTAVA
ncbi:type I polyketide synthase [Agrobacterium sp. rho-13.3]|uniref:type I polyketide synthase n=1 Tax=Agrobacterium sp. rho-13.3 TaxID=3072980 RepID=UPI002A0B1DD0|nr:type I polyketide synthase [Agrobacterium sp. rho-13.3]MDX8311734.1 type I polyketide synthase [Agrobacterium sp. rho-13.3]